MKLLPLSPKESIYFTMNEIEAGLSQEKINFINGTYKKELQYWKKAAFKKALNGNEAKELTDLAPSRVSFLIRKAAIKKAKKMNIHEIIFHLKFQYSVNRNQITLIQDIPSEDTCLLLKQYLKN